MVRCKMLPQKIPLIFYRSAGGKEPVREWLKDLDPADRLVVGQDLMRAQWRWPVGMPLAVLWALGDTHGIALQSNCASVPVP